MKPSLHVVGLSATLRDAVAHLGGLAHISPSKIEEFRPRTDEMELEGIEYNLAIKGDPASGSALLSTSIQTGMLLSRLLTKPNHIPDPSPDAIHPESYYRTKLFGFSDNLDSINRWFSDMSDAESKRLARLRTPPAGASAPELAQRDAEGQIWRLPMALGHDLGRPLLLSRCSSQDPGANAASQMIIATSSLEVGFDDPDVAAILQHKSPRSIASFVQRKGRAGRKRLSRPWTVVVLSDYGRDRERFHSAERLFDPELENIFLPIHNPHVLRVQMTLFVIDWIGHRIGTEIGPFQYLAGPKKGKPWAPFVEVQSKASAKLAKLIEQGSEWDDFYREALGFLGFYLASNDPGFAKQQLDQILWKEPRPVLTQAIPSLLRKLEKKWRVDDPAQSQVIEDKESNRPLPSYIPQTTFMDLDIDEGHLHFGGGADPERVAISRLLFESCPGRVSKRYSIQVGDRGYWHQYSDSLQAGDKEAPIATIYPQSHHIATIGQTQVYQPEVAQLTRRPPDATTSDASSAQWLWQIWGRTQGEAELLPVGLGAPWSKVIKTADAYLHSNGALAEVICYSSKLSFGIRDRTPAKSRAGTLSLKNGDAVQAVGICLRADGLVFDIDPAHLSTVSALPPDILARFRADYFAFRLRTHPLLQGRVNMFQAEWLAQISLSMLTATALRNSIGLKEAQAKIPGNRLTSVTRVLEAIFQSQGGQDTGGLHEKLLDLWRDPQILKGILECEPVLWEPAGPELEAWAKRRYLTTLAQGLRSAVCAIDDQVSEEDLGIAIFEEGGAHRIIITERHSGGLGQIEGIVGTIKREPERFLQALEHSLLECPRGRSNADLGEIVSQAASGQDAPGSIPVAFAAARQASGFAEMETAREDLRSAVQSRGILPSKSLIVAVMTKLLRPGSSKEMDSFICAINELWTKKSQDLMAQIPPRAFAFFVSTDPALKARVADLLKQISGGEEPSDLQIYAQVQQMLIEGCEDSCEDCLRQRDQYIDYPPASRALASRWLNLNVEEIRISVDPEADLKGAMEALRRSGKVRISALESERSQLQKLVIALTGKDLDCNGLFHSVALVQTDRSLGRFLATLQVKDMPNG